MVDESVFPRHDAIAFGQLLTKTIEQAIAEMQLLGVTKAVYWALPSTPRETGHILMMIEVPFDEFPWKHEGVTIEVSSNIGEFYLVLPLVDGKVSLRTEMTIDALLEMHHRDILESLSSDEILKLVNALEKWINDRRSSIQGSYQKDPAKMRWYLMEPELVRRKEQLKTLHQIDVQKTEKTPTP